jgi:hypothetical protein
LIFFWVTNSLFLKNCHNRMRHERVFKIILFSYFEYHQI